MNEVETQLEASVESERTFECRACLQLLSEECVLYNIFEGWMPPWDGMENSIAEDLAKIANVQISESDIHSKIICETCCQLLLSACNFTAIVRRNNEILRQRCGEDTKELNSSNERVWPKPIRLDKSIPCSMYENIDIKQEIVSDDEQCPAANGSYDPSTDDLNLDIIKIEPEEIIQQQPLQIHVTVNGREEIDHLPNTKESHLTNGTVDSGERLKSEIKEEPVSDEDDSDQANSDLSLDCMLCNKPFNSVSGLKAERNETPVRKKGEHSEDDMRKALELVKYGMSMIKASEAHVIAQHSYKSVKRKRLNSVSPEKKISKYMCAICRRIFTTSTDLMVHETCHNKSVCYGCTQSFDTFAQLTAHRRTCKAIANKEVKKPRTLDDVLRPQLKEQTTNLRCTLCNETFTDVYYMNIHQEIHHSNSEEN